MKWTLTSLLSAFAAFSISGEFSDNHFTLLPGEPRTLTFTPRDPKTTFNDFKKSLIVKHIRETY